MYFSAQDGRTVLHLALLNNQTQVARVLIGAGANVNAEDKGGTRPLTLALGQQNDEMRALLSEHGGTENARDVQVRVDREKYMTRRYSIQTVRWPRCDRFEMGTVCERISLRDADEIEVVSDREMRLTFYNGKTLVAEGGSGKETKRENYVAVVRDRVVVEESRNLVDWRYAGCKSVPGHSDYCWDEKGQVCEKWRTHEGGSCGSSVVGK